MAQVVWFLPPQGRHILHVQLPATPCPFPEGCRCLGSEETARESLLVSFVFKQVVNILSYDQNRMVWEARARVTYPMGGKELCFEEGGVKQGLGPTGRLWKRNWGWRMREKAGLPRWELLAMGPTCLRTTHETLMWLETLALDKGKLGQGSPHFNLKTKTWPFSSQESMR